LNGSRFDSLSEAYRERHGRVCAHVTWTRGQAIGYAIAVALLWAAFVAAPFVAWVCFSYVVAAFLAGVLGIRLLALVARMGRDATTEVDHTALAALRDGDLPVYSAMVPLYREPEVVPELLAALERMDYPKDKLDVQLLLEPDDTATREALERHALPPYLRVTVSPGGFPRTKPRACNVGLESARGEFVVVFDAEDRPDPDQLKKAVAAYRRMPADVVCLQCRLSHYNSRRSLPARWSEMEYLVWYRYLLPGLQRIGAPIPLGGTSNHFRAGALRELGGWDPFNVTEDCDLGMRIARRGWRTCILASTTWEESVTTFGGWIRQRSRWMKGYWQTWLVHSRNGFLREFGLWQGFLFVLLVGGCSALLLNPLLWGVILAWLAIGWPIVDAADPVSLSALAVTLVMLAANVVFVVLNMAVCALARRPDLVPAALLSPLEWTLLSVAAWKGWLQFFGRPFHWDKTHHGRSAADEKAEEDRRLWRHAWAVGSFAALALASAVGAVLMHVRIERQLAAQAPDRPVQLASRFTSNELASAVLLYGFDDGSQGWRSTNSEASVVAGIRVMDEGPYLLTGLLLPGEIELSARPRADWSGYKGLVLDMQAPTNAPQDLKVTLLCRDRDRLWYQYESPQRLVPGRWTRVEVGLGPNDRCWRPQGDRKPWDGYSPQRIREFGFRVHSRSAFRGILRLDNVRAVPYAPDERPDRRPLDIAIRGTSVVSVARYGRFEASFQTSRVYANPFDPDEVQASGVFRAPSGKVATVPAFWYQDFERRLGERGETLSPVGRAYWRIRFTPVETGRHTASVRVRDASGDAFQQELPAFDVTPSDNPGFVRRSRAKPQYLVHDDGTPFYLVGHNACWPVDLEPPYAYDFTVPPDQGTFTYDRWFASMAANGENWTRIWLSQHNLGIEGPTDWTWFGGMGRYSLAQAWRLDHVVSEAERLDIRLTLTLQHKSEYDNSWRHHAYYRGNGGPLERSIELFTNPVTIKAHRDRMRYLVARWGGSPNVLAWELWGEVNLVPGYPQATEAVTEWHREMSAELRRLDPWRHLVFTHCHNWQNGHNLWALPGIDCVQGNGYIRPPNRTPDHVDNFRRYLSEVESYNKPVFVAEYGGRSELGAPSADYLEAQLHSGLWASVMHPFAGVAKAWWWNFIEGRNLYGHYKGLSAFVRDINRVRDDYAVVTPAVESAAGVLNAAGMNSTSQAVVWVYHKDVFTKWESLPAVTDAVLSLDGLVRPPCRVEYWNTMTGEVTHETIAAGAAPRLRLPPVRRDLAVKIFPASTSGNSSGNPD
jgi:cellulose synthase/poly-beta-1,6-N-acetylglucosamine synthase-like glycosyltransferase